jgi:hypothetical protein
MQVPYSHSQLYPVQISPVSETELSSIHITPSDQNPEITLTQADGDRLVEQPTEHQDDVALLSVSVARQTQTWNSPTPLTLR